jgi:hypothetical protein
MRENRAHFASLAAPQRLRLPAATNSRQTLSGGRKFGE